MKWIAPAPDPKVLSPSPNAVGHFDCGNTPSLIHEDLVHGGEAQCVPIDWTE